MSARHNSGEPVDADWLVDWVYLQLKSEVIYHEREAAVKTAEAGVTF